MLAPRHPPTTPMNRPEIGGIGAMGAFVVAEVA